MEALRSPSSTATTSSASWSGSRWDVLKARRIHDETDATRTVRLKHLTNIRSANKEATVTLKTARQMSLEECIEYIEDDELIELTPGPIRMRKKILDESMRKRADRQSRDREEATKA